MVSLRRCVTLAIRVCLRTARLRPLTHLGTVTHVPPEVFSNDVFHLAADVWAFGVVAWEAYHGKCAYCGLSPHQIIVAVVVRKKQLEWAYDPPADFVSLMGRCLAYDREQRPTFFEVSAKLNF
mmetsp:Transcript_94557/g.305849  ORF Transcript_94557/g.305849 Transcript_94557/m.305849 type:complete len:123 (-) Transcript_94557:300-668(-)